MIKAHTATKLIQATVERQGQRIQVITHIKQILTHLILFMTSFRKYLSLCPILLYDNRIDCLLPNVGMQDVSA